MAMSKQAKIDRLWQIIEVNDIPIQALCDLMEIDREEFFRLLRSKFLENYDVFDCLGDYDDDN